MKMAKSRWKMELEKLLEYEKRLVEAKTRKELREASRLLSMQTEKIGQMIEEMNRKNN